MESILNLTKEELQKECDKLGLKSFRTIQVLDWIYKKLIFDFQLMNNLSKGDRTLLSDNYSIIDLSLKKMLKSKTREAIKYLFQTSDNHFIETVLIRSRNRNTLCISTQAGCPLNCLFCATGKMGFKRDLKTSEILSQVLWISKEIEQSRGSGIPKEKEINNIVFMGMGEPFLNYNAVLKAVYTLNSSDCYNLGARHITISTVGITDGIHKLISENIQVRLALSLNSPLQEVREKIMPAGKSNKLTELLRLLKKYQHNTKRRITFEYIMLKNINIDETSARELSKILKQFKYNLNIIEYNALCSNDPMQPLQSEINIFKQYLKKYNITFTERLSKGNDIHAACGQLGLDTK